MTESLDRIEPRGLVCRKEPEHHADHPRKDKSNEGNHRTRSEGEIHQNTSEIGRGKPKSDADDAPEGCENDRLDKELDHHIVVEGTDCEANTDLPRSFGDRYQHDVHDADAAYEQADGGNRAEQCGQDLHRRSQGGEELLRVHHREVVFLAGLDATALAHKGNNFILDELRVGIAANPNLDGGDLAIARDHALVGMQRHQHEVILIHSHSTLAFGREQPDDLARYGLQSDACADRILIGKKLLANILTNDADGRAGSDLRVRKLAAGLNGPIANIEVGVVDAVDGRRPVRVRVDGLHGFGGCWRHGAHARDIAVDRLHVGLFEELCFGAKSTRRSTLLAGHQGKDVLPQGVNLRGNACGGSVANRDHRDDRGDTDDDTQHGQYRTHDIAANG